MLDYLNCMSCGMEGINMGAAFCPSCGFPLTAEGIKEAESAHKREISSLRDRTDNLEDEVKYLREFVNHMIESVEGRPVEEVLRNFKPES